MSISPEAPALQAISPEQAWHYKIVPIRMTSAGLHVLCSRQNSTETAELELILGYPISTESCAEDQLQVLLEKHYRIAKPNHGEVQIKSNSGAKDFMAKLIAEAKALGSSDIHLEVYELLCRIRLRIDGKLAERHRISKEEYPALVNKIKIFANLDIAEKRLPQDGRIFFEGGGNKTDIRVSVLPTLYGEKIVLRLLGSDVTDIDINTLGFNKHDLDRYLESIRKPHGMLLISGPTGSGKTTTLYATLKLLNSEERNIVTIEDPIEYTLQGINQVQLRENIGLDFPSALKTFLRQDPDVIMVGEIRDPATANVAIRASLTGHLVLSTIHTNSAWDTIARLVDMGVAPYLIANTLNMSVAQRLVRKLCANCKKKKVLSPGMLPPGYDYQALAECYIAHGCSSCYHTGYSGRIAIYEVLHIDPEFAELIKKSENEAKSLMKAKGIKTLADNAIELLYKGVTSADEIYPILLSR